MTTPAMNIMKTADFHDSIFYRSSCDCTDSDHDHTIIVEFDDDILTCSIYQQLEWCDYKAREKNIVVRVWRRLYWCAKFLFTGYAKVEGHHLFCKEEAMRDYANAILGAVDELKRRREVSVVQAKARLEERRRASLDSENLQRTGDSNTA